MSNQARAKMHRAMTASKELWEQRFSGAGVAVAIVGGAALAVPGRAAAIRASHRSGAPEEVD
jgi:hypothetical protein